MWDLLAAWVGGVVTCAIVYEILRNRSKQVVKFDCPDCGLKSVAVDVPRRDYGMMFSYWYNGYVMPIVMARHRRLSPRCYNHHIYVQTPRSV